MSRHSRPYAATRVSPRKALGGIGLMLALVTRLATLMLRTRRDGKADMPGET